MHTQWFRKWFLWLSVGALMAGCASTAKRDQELPELVPADLVQQPAEPPKSKEFWEAISKANVIYVPERHDDDAHHEFQFELIRSMRSRGYAFAIGWEMFDLTEQPLLDEWQARKVQTDELLKRVNWQKSWGVYSHLYEQMLRWAQSAGIPCLALNATRQMSRKLVKGEPFTDAEIQLLPSKFQLPPDGYEHFVEQMAKHPGAKGQDLRPYYRAQVLWEQTMAHRIDQFLQANPNKKLVVFLGRGHASENYGVPFYVRQRGKPQQLLLMPGGPLEEGKHINLVLSFKKPLRDPVRS